MSGDATPGSVGWRTAKQAMDGICISVRVTTTRQADSLSIIQNDLRVDSKPS